MIKAQRSLWFLVSARIASDPRISILKFRCFCYETMSNCSQNCWIDLNPAALCFKRLFHTGGMNVCLICEASLSYHTLYIWNLVSAYTCITYFPVCKKKDYPQNKPKNASPHRFWSWQMTRNLSFFGGPNPVMFIFLTGFQNLLENMRFVSQNLKYITAVIHFPDYNECKHIWMHWYNDRVSVHLSWFL